MSKALNGISQDIKKLSKLLEFKPKSTDLIPLGKVSIPINSAQLCYNCKSIFDSSFNLSKCPSCKSVFYDPVAVAYRKPDGMSSPIIADVKQDKK
jgi:hypothetical protein